jgi:hypothetical protein
MKPDLVGPSRQADPPGAPELNKYTASCGNSCAWER